MIPIVTFFYSNFSGNCKALLQQIKNLNLDKHLSIKYINIDNDTIKQYILKKFSQVPTIVVILDEEISLYSGNNAFEWFNFFHQSMEEHELKKSEVVAEFKPKSILEIAAELSKEREK